MKSTNTKSSSGDKLSQNIARKGSKKPWEPMKLTYAGEAKDIVRGGTGKTGITQADMGDTNKPKGQT
jgi:hypothetical protein